MLHHNCSVEKRYEDKEAEDIKRGNGRRLFIWGTVVYEDVFGITQRTDFAHSIFWVLYKDGTEHPYGDYADRHNDVT